MKKNKNYNKNSKIYHILIIKKYLKIKKKMKKEEEKKEEKKEEEKKKDELIPQRPELEKIKSQRIQFYTASDNLPQHPRTIYFNYNPKYIKNNQISTKGKITQYEIISKKYMVVYKAYKGHPICIKETMKSNNIIRTRLFEDANLIWKLFSNNNEMIALIKSLNKYQRYNHFPISWELSRKDFLYTHYKIMEKKFPKDYLFMPQSYILPRDKELIELSFKNYKLEKDDIWICKPIDSSKGRGIRLLTSFNNLPLKGIISHYIHNPHLINEKKYDLRLYVLVTGFFPLKIYLFKEGVARFASEKYDVKLKENKLNHRKIHITDFIQESDDENDKSDSSDSSESSDDYKKNKNINTAFDANKERVSLHELKNWFSDNKIHFSTIMKKIKDIIIKVFISITDYAIPKIKELNVNSVNLFEIFGIDILIDERLRPWLMEVNLNPSLNSDNKLEKEIKYKLIPDIMNIIGLIPYSHDGNYKIYDLEPFYKNNIEESVIESLQEFDRNNGEFERIFPLMENIDIYNKFLEKPGDENLALWDAIKNKTKFK